MAAFDPTDPRNLNPEQRLDELTAILATGVRRLMALHESPVTPAESQPSDTRQNLPRIDLMRRQRHGHMSRVADGSIERERS